MSEHGFNQTKLAAELQVEQPTVWGWLHGKAYPRMDTLKKLCELTGMSMDELLIGTVQKKSRRKTN